MKKPTRSTRALYGVTVAALCLLGVAAVVVLAIVDSGPELAGQLVSTAVVLFLLGVAGFAASALLGDGRLAALGWLALLACAAALTLVTIALWSKFDEGGSVAIWKAAGSLFATAFALAHASVVLSRRNSLDGSLVRGFVGLTLFASAGLAALLIIAMYAEIGASLYYRFVAIATVLWMLPTALVPILRRMQHVA
jgi:hypothetical protein